ncbi:MAG TPA: hypothetical protein VFA71_10445, partial [Terriglobales bacterium]|nr:hypothetical protein [Terriglobales bacterium]
MGLRKLVWVLVVVCSSLFLSSCGTDTQNTAKQQQSPPAVTVTPTPTPIPTPTPTPTPPPAQPQQIVYITHQQTVSTYLVDGGTGSMNFAGPDIQMSSPPPKGFFPAIFPTTDDHFIYVTWTDARYGQHISVFATDRQGIPQAPAVQTVDISGLGLFAINPSGKFAYLFQSVSDGGDGEIGSGVIHLWSVDPATGELADTGMQVKEPQFTFGSVSPYRISGDGNTLYTVGIVSFDGFGYTDYLQHSLDPQSGAVGPSQQFYTADWEWGDTDVTTIGKKYVANYFNALSWRVPQMTYIDVVPVQDTSTASIHCTSTMTDACLNAGNVRFDVSGDFLFVTDVVLKQIRVLKVDATAKTLHDTG